MVLSLALVSVKPCGISRVLWDIPQTPRTAKYQNLLSLRGRGDMRDVSMVYPLVVLMHYVSISLSSLYIKSDISPFIGLIPHPPRPSCSDTCIPPKDPAHPAHPVSDWHCTTYSCGDVCGVFDISSTPNSSRNASNLSFFQTIAARLSTVTVGLNPMRCKILLTEFLCSFLS